MLELQSHQIHGHRKGVNMKRKIFLILLLICLFGISGCTKNKEYTPSGDKMTLTLKDEGFGETTLNYYTDDGYEIETSNNGLKKSITITCKEDNFRLQLYHMDGYYKDYEELKNAVYSSRVSEEYTWNNYQAVAYNREDFDEDDMLNFKVFLESGEETSKLLYGLFEYINPEDKEIIQLFRSAKVQKMLGTIKFKETIDE